MKIGLLIGLLLVVSNIVYAQLYTYSFPVPGNGTRASHVLVHGNDSIVLQKTVPDMRSINRNLIFDHKVYSFRYNPSNKHDELMLGNQLLGFGNTSMESEYYVFSDASYRPYTIRKSGQLEWEVASNDTVLVRARYVKSGVTGAIEFVKNDALNFKSEISLLLASAYSTIIINKNPTIFRDVPAKDGIISKQNSVPATPSISNGTKIYEHTIIGSGMKKFHCFINDGDTVKVHLRINVRSFYYRSMIAQGVKYTLFYNKEKKIDELISSDGKNVGFANKKIDSGDLYMFTDDKGRMYRILKQVGSKQWEVWGNGALLVTGEFVKEEGIRRLKLSIEDSEKEETAVALLIAYMYTAQIYYTKVIAPAAFGEGFAVGFFLGLLNHYTQDNR